MDQMSDEIKRVKRELKFKGKIIDFYQDTMEINGDHTVIWDFIKHKGAAAVVPVTDEGKILMVRQYRNALERYTLALFERGTQMAAERGLILVDTKYEFGKHNGEIYLMDEIHTPDSSRYFYSEGYQERFENGEPQKQLSKEFVREWLMANGFQGKEGQKVPEMTPAIVSSISDRYIELYEHITGETFVKADTDQLAERIEKNVTEYLG